MAFGRRPAVRENRVESARGSARPLDGGSEELFRHLVESATDYAIITLDPQGHVASWNAGAERLIGYSESEILGQSADVIFTPEDRRNGVPDAERMLASRDGRAQDERWHLRKDGSLFWGSGIMSPLSSGSGFVKIMRDRTEQRRAEERIAQSEERFRILATNIPQLAFRGRSSGERSWGSPQWEIYTGLSEERSLGLGWLDAVHPDDRQATMEAWRNAERNGAYYIEHRIRRNADGEFRWHQTRASPAPSSDGSATEWVGTSTDIHDLRALQTRQQVLLAELQHRTRNLLAVVQALARQTMRSQTTLEGFAVEFESRLRALSRAQALVASTARETVALRALVEMEISAHSRDGSAKIHIDGPHVELPVTAVQTTALALHELATNSVKYGAIGQASGRLSVTWHLDEAEPDHARVVLDWQESGVVMPQNTWPRRKGYGSELIERSLPYQLHAETRLTYGEDGIRCMIAVPIPNGTEEAR